LNSSIKIVVAIEKALRWAAFSCPGIFFVYMTGVFSLKRKEDVVIHHSHANLVKISGDCLILFEI